MTIQEDHLGEVPFGSIHRAFVEAFADYAVDVAAVTEQHFMRRARKNNWNPALSSGVWVDNRLVAITLIGTDELNRERIAYDICTGVIPSNRRNGLAGIMLDRIITRLEGVGVSALQLEVLQANSAAIGVYEKSGFFRTRGLDGSVCNATAVKAANCEFNISPARHSDVTQLFRQMNFVPSFEQRDRALEILEPELLILGAFQDGECIGAIAHDPATGWIMRIVVDGAYRRQGIASALVYELSQQLGPQEVIKAINIDASDLATTALLRTCGFTDSHSQWEMRLELGG